MSHLCLAAVVAESQPEPADHRSQPPAPLAPLPERSSATRQTAQHLQLEAFNAALLALLAAVRQQMTLEYEL